MRTTLQVISLIGFAVAAACGTWMILYARAARMFVWGGVLVTVCGVAGIITTTLPSSPERQLARVLLGLLIVLSVVVFNSTWRDAVTTGKFGKPESVRAVFRNLLGF